MSNCQLCKCFRDIYAERIAFARPAGIDAATLFGERLSTGFDDDDDDDYEEDWDDDDWEYDDSDDDEFDGDFDDED